MSNTITAIGNLTADVELRFTNNGVPVATFTIAMNERKKNANGEWENAGATFLRVNAWRELAENAADSFKKGQQVIVTGLLRNRTWQDKEGNNRDSYEIEARELGASIRFGTTTFTPKTAGQPQQPQQPQQQWPQQPAAGTFAPNNYNQTPPQQQPQQQQANAWGNQPQDDTPPF